jgi:hypothetical protein
MEEQEQSGRAACIQDSKSNIQHPSPFCVLCAFLRLDLFPPASTLIERRYISRENRPHHHR